MMDDHYTDPNGGSITHPLKPPRCPHSTPETHSNSFSVSQYPVYLCSDVVQPLCKHTHTNISCFLAKITIYFLALSSACHEPIVTGHLPMKTHQI